MELAIDGFGAPVHLDQDASVTAVLCVGGVCLYVNERYCKNVLVRERLCTKDVELLSVSLHFPYLPSEFPKYSSQWYTSIAGQTCIKL